VIPLLDRPANYLFNRWSARFAARRPACCLLPSDRCVESRPQGVEARLRGRGQQSIAEGLDDLIESQRATVRGAAANHPQSRPERASHGGDLRPP